MAGDNNVFRNSALIMAAASGMLLWLAFPPLQIGCLAWVALVPLGLAVVRARSFWQGSALGAFFGAVWILTCLDWLRTAYPNASATGQPFLGVWLAFGSWGALSAGMTTGALWLLVKRLHWPAAVGLPVAWVIGEEVRDVFCRFVAGTTTDMVRLALTQVGCLPVLQSADLGGAPVVAWFVAAGNGCAVDTLRHDRTRQGAHPTQLAAVMASIFAIAAMFAYGILRLAHNSTESLIIGVVPSSLGRDAKLDCCRQFQNVDLAVCPEGGVAEAIAALPSSEAPRNLRDVSAAAQCPLLAGCDRISTTSAALYNSVVLVSPSGRITGFADKRFLTPLQETRPPLAFWLFRQGAFAMTPYTTGREVRPLTLPSGTRIGVGICHDICHPEWGRDLCVAAPPSLLIHYASERFDGTGRATSFMLACAQLRAVECRRAVVRCAQTGPSAVIDAAGRVLAPALGESSSAPRTERRVPIDSQASLFVAYGSNVAFATMLLTAVLTQWLCRPLIKRNEPS